MPSSVFISSVRSAFALGLSAGLVLASAVFLAWPGLATTARATAGVPVATESPAAPHVNAPATAAEDDLRDAIATSAMFLNAAPGTSGTRPAPQAGGGKAATLIASAEDHRRRREFKEACAAYAEAAAQGAMTADSWADYADAQGSLAGQLAGEPEQAITRALALDPRHPKALWLKASLAHEQHRYEDALVAWRQLLAVVPPGSSDARIVEANIAEAARLAAG